MLRLFLVTDPTEAHVPALVNALRVTPPDEVHAPASMQPVAAALVGVPAATDAALEDGAAAIALIEAIAARRDGTALVLAGEPVARQIVHHALAAPVATDRIAFDPGGLAEIEVRLDEPWTVNRLNDRCHGDHPGWLVL